MQELVAGEEGKLPLELPALHCRYRDLPLTRGRLPQCAALLAMAAGQDTDCWNSTGTGYNCRTVASLESWVPQFVVIDEGDV